MAERTSKRKWDEAEEEQKPVLDPAAQAAAIAAKIAATMGSLGASKPVKDEKPGAHDGPYTHDIEINDLRNRYLLTKGSTQAQIGGETGASIVTKGLWLPDKTKATPAEPPLYLHIAASNQAQLDAAVAKVNELINQELGPLVEDRSQWARNRERYNAETAMGGPGGPRERRKWPEEKLHINLESLRNFNVRAKVVGPGGMFVKYIQAETGTRVQIKGQGSGFYETETGRESDDPMHINITGPDEAMIARAKTLAEDLLEVVRGEYAKAQAASASGFGMGYPGVNYQQQQQQPGYGAGYAGYPGYGQPTDGQQPPLPAGTPGAASAGTPSQAGAATPANGDPNAAAADPAAAYEQYRAYWAAYGYDVNDPAFQAWQATQTAGQTGADGQAAAAPAAPAGQPPAAPPS